MLDLINTTNSEDWLSTLDTSDQNRVRELLATGLTTDEAADFWLDRTGSNNTFGFGGTGQPSNYKAAVEAELRKLICGDPGYLDLRNKISQQWDTNGKTLVVSTIAIAVSSVTGVAVGVLTTVIALLLATVCRVGLNAWCAVKA